MHAKEYNFDEIRFRRKVLKLHDKEKHLFGNAGCFKFANLNHFWVDSKMRVTNAPTISRTPSTAPLEAGVSRGVAKNKNNRTSACLDIGIS